MRNSSRHRNTASSSRKRCCLRHASMAAWNSASKLGSASGPAGGFGWDLFIGQKNIGGGVDLLVQPALPGDEPLTVENGEGLVSGCDRRGQVGSIETID